MNKNSQNGLKGSTVISVCLAAFLVAFAAVPAQAQQTTVSLTTPELVKGSTAYAALEIDNVNNLDAGQFDMSFNSDVLKVVNVEDGSIEGTKIPVQWRSIDGDAVRVIFNLEGVTGISGSGQLARIGFEVIGDGESNLLISSGLLGNTEANRIDTDWGVTTASDVPESTPGFEAVFALVGLIAVFCLVTFSRKL
ncbi:cohesin domain-containing protein [Methanococcoides sp.]|uniref:cohesin domain-containing protein n=1 Tax=Methanococcoides sp. TaxID=1966350 RepID=UPI00272E2F76|nr:cohesin domain-containing protein [Methanococcoides sp.]